MNKIIDLLKIDDNYYIFLINLLAFITISIVIYFLIKWFKNSYIKYIIPFLNALLLTFFTIFYSGDVPILFSEQVSLYQYISFISKDLFNSDPASELLKNDSPIFIDISYDQTLISNEEKNESWNSKLTVTDRKKLATFFKLINPLADSLVDLVICDLLFTRSADDPIIDNNLSKQIHLLNKKGKLILAQSKIEDGFSIITDQNNNTLQRANVDIKKYFGNSFFTVNTQTDSLFPSLPYLLYLKLDSIPQPRNTSKYLFYREGNSYAVTSFVPNIIFNPNFLEEEDNNGLKSIHNSIYQFFYLGQSIDTLQSGFHLFYETLKENKKQHKRNILIVGAFEDPLNDTHETLAGSMHGPILLFNIFLNYRSKAHIISLGFILYLLIGFSFISFLNFSSRFIKDNFPKLNNLTTSISNKKRIFCKKIVTFLIHKNFILLKNFTRKIIFPFIGNIISIYAYLLLFIFLTTAIIYFHHFINIIAVSIYFFILDKVLAVFIPNYDKH